jgi:Ner family transcriptional regulator
MPKKPRTPDARAARIRAMLADRGLSLTALDQRERLYPGQTQNALYEPDQAGESAIAQALGKTPQELWPERFDATGIRYVPQPRENYRARVGASRRIARVA